ncbi:oligopeptide/dipeptide ABC transporter ATP-binding protein [Nonomuraea sp. C10]|uniref:oligopeptide/dipeptide ABC transporter ATP-binding protein n=1 Tax=Nonomuraea sp. C10 TaxID=2600577 RepID=UPI0011CE6505|nr:oligopeptide/dipeptide ABC transporter ATP-binding protein [Nonomuraea sp. C10]TXK34020.1 ATP-binding cassette domain-containing protein [Nonomuraea sp. C10]
MIAVRAEGLVKHYRTGGGRTLRAVDGVTFEVPQGRTLAVIGESGCGKSTIARMLVRLAEPTEGRIQVQGSEQADRRAIQLVSQNPWSALNRRKSIGHALRQPLAVHGLHPGRAARDARVRELLDLVGLTEEYLGRRPGGVSGGELQRVTVARALAVEPKVLVLDEPTASLDVSVKALLVNLLQDLRQRLGLSYVLITHEIDIARHLADDVAVMYLGRFVETGTADQVFDDPRHPYTRALLAAVPDPGRPPAAPLTGEVPSALAPPPGCRFHTRCPLATAACEATDPALEPATDGRLIACIHEETA